MSSKRNPEDLLKSSPHFCMVPWTHMHTWPNGNVLPCCVSDGSLPHSRINDNYSIQEAWNSPKMRELRLNMLENKASEECRRCYEMESKGFDTLRIQHNLQFAHHFDLVSQTKNDGSVEKLNIVYLDFRFSNLCNLSCRTCGPELSSSWAADAKMLNMPTTDIGIIKPFQNDRKFIDQIYELLPSVEKIYFAGGEPLIMDEHYSILNRLIELKRTDVQLVYNTNFSSLQYKQYDVLEIWKKFKSVSIGASLDATYEKANYLRRGSNWEKIENNRKLTLEKLKHLKFYINFTLSAFNVFEAPVFHKEWVSKGYININEFNFSPLTNPHYYRINILPESALDNARMTYLKHFEWIKESGNLEAISQWENALKWLQVEHDPSLLKQFRSITTALDRTRNESFEEIFPELYQLLF